MNSSAIGAAVLAAGMAAAVTLAGCTSSGGGAGADSKAASTGGGAHALAAPRTAAGAGSGAFSGSVTSSGDSVKVTSLALVRTATLHVRIAHAPEVTRAADRADEIAIASGGSVYADDRTAGRHASASLTLKVPPAALDAVLNRLAELGKEIARTSSTKDVTSQVADVASRTLSARKSLARLRALYGEATTVRDVIEIESEIATREADLESLQARQRALSGETATATIALTLTAAKHAAAPPAHHARGGFLGGLTSGWHAFTASLTALATALGAVLPFLVVLLVLALISWRVRRRLRSGRPGPADPEPSPSR